MRHRQRGFTVVEILLALSIALPVTLALLGLARLALRGAQTASATAAAAATVTELVERLDAESHGAAALFEPANDVLGSGSCDEQGACRELDFFTRDSGGLPHFWAYTFDPKKHLLQRYDYDDLGSDGPIGLRALGDPVPLESFSVKTLPVSQVTIPALRGYVPKDVSVSLGYSQFTGGNALAAVDVANAAFHLHHELVPRLAATGFTVVVGTYTPAPQTSPAPSPTPTSRSGGGEPRDYIAYILWMTGPCVNEPPGTPGCGPSGSGLEQDQQGDSFGPGGSLVAPPNSQIPLSDVCQPTDGSLNPNAQSPLGEYDATGLLYGSVSDPVTGITEAWFAASTGYVVPTPPLIPAFGDEADPFRATMKNGPGYSYDTIYQVGC